MIKSGILGVGIVLCSSCLAAQERGPETGPGVSIPKESVRSLLSHKVGNKWVITLYSRIEVQKVKRADGKIGKMEGMRHWLERKTLSGEGETRLIWHMLSALAAYAGSEPRHFVIATRDDRAMAFAFIKGFVLRCYEVDLANADTSEPIDAACPKDWRSPKDGWTLATNTPNQLRLPQLLKQQFGPKFPLPMGVKQIDYVRPRARSCWEVSVTIRDATLVVLRDPSMKRDGWRVLSARRRPKTK